MKKKLLCLALAIVFVISLTSCFKGDKKYNYKNMSKYIDLADYEGFVAVVDMDVIQSTIDSYLMDYAAAYTVKKGDVITISLSDVYYVNYDEEGRDTKGEELKELAKEYVVKLGEGKFCDSIEYALVGYELNKSISGKSMLSDEFEIPEFQGKEVYYSAKVVAVDYVTKIGDIIEVEYEGFHIDANGNIEIDIDENGKEIEKMFNDGKTKSFLGSHLAIDDFENGLLGIKIGASTEFYATFPDDYNQYDDEGNDLSGKKVLFRCTITNLYETPIFNDEFVRKNLKADYDVETAEDFEQALIDAKVRNLISENLQDNSTVRKFPKHEYKIAESQLNSDLQNTYLEFYLQYYYHMTPEEYLEMQLKTELIYYAIAKEQDIAPTEKSVEKARKKYKEDLIKDYMETYNATRDEAENYATVYLDNQVSQYYFYDQELYNLVDEYLFDITKVDFKDRTKKYISQEMAEEYEKNNPKENDESNESTDA